MPHDPSHAEAQPNPTDQLNALLGALFASGPLPALARAEGMELAEFVEWAGSEDVTRLIDAARRLEDLHARAALAAQRAKAVEHLAHILEVHPPGETTRRAATDLLRARIQPEPRPEPNRDAEQPRKEPLPAWYQMPGPEDTRPGAQDEDVPPFSSIERKDPPEDEHEDAASSPPRWGGARGGAADRGAPTEEPHPPTPPQRGGEWKEADRFSGPHEGGARGFG